MRHRWKKKRFKKRWYPDSTLRAHLREVKTYDTKECIFCKLRKGYSKEYGFFPVIVYFDTTEILSKDKLPFTCNEIAKDAFIEIEEFSV